MSTYALQLKHQLTIGALEVIGFGSIVVDCYSGEIIRSKLACCVPKLNHIGLVSVERISIDHVRYINILTFGSKLEIVKFILSLNFQKRLGY